MTAVHALDLRTTAPTGTVTVDGLMLTQGDNGRLELWLPDGPSEVVRTWVNRGSGYVASRELAVGCGVAFAVVAWDREAGVDLIVIPVVSRLTVGSPPDADSLDEF